MGKNWHLKSQKSTTAQWTVFLLKMSLTCKFFCFSKGKKRFKRHLTEKRIFLFLSNLLLLHSKPLEIENFSPQLMCINHSSWQHLFWASAPPDKCYYFCTEGKLLLLAVGTFFQNLNIQISCLLLQNMEVSPSKLLAFFNWHRFQWIIMGTHHLCILVRLGTIMKV